MRILLLFLLLLYSFHVTAMPVLLSPDQQRHELFAVSLLEDKQGALSAKQAWAQHHWQPYTNRLSLGYSASTYWLKLVVRNNSVQPLQRYLQFSESFLKEVSLYQFVDGNWLEMKNGAAVPTRQKQQPYAFPTFLVQVAKQSDTMLLIKIRSDFGIFGKLSIHESQDFYHQHLARNSIHVFMFGAIVIIALFNFCLWVRLKDKIYLYYVAYATGFIGWLSLYSGHFLQFFSPQYFVPANISLPLAFVFLILFSRALLHVKEEFPLINKGLDYLLAGFLVAVALIPFSARTGFLLGNTLGLVLMPTLLVLGILGVRRKLINARVYTIALAVYFIGISVLGLMALGLLPYNLVTRYSAFPGAMLELILFSLALANRINFHKEQAITAQRRLVQVSQNTNQELERMVKRRTKELLKQKQQLELLAITDSLTNLHNRRAFRDTFEFMASAVPEKSVLVLAMMDIDLFKVYNDTYGHQKGDDALVAVAKVLQQSADGCAGSAFRLGGEEFALLFFSSDSQYTSAVIEKCRTDILALNIEHQGNASGYLSASFGVASSDSVERVSMRGLYKNADLALYEAKAKGRNNAQVFSLVANVI